ncbi:hypothetical protein [Streptomyces formicae]|uniref:Class I SAM-dependent methyltransferase n=1 Tax=Streptomyces formicae TaxID=1616117 RepID=A0A291Q0B4_9ACTN|nr:hypothetical protein [Streptomyces formicae]ATL25039.1 hypothetical protein KY5_0021 [Streptomyces formicae]ATL33160.1 hypothetical protein KY5_8142c [Streptomyces formicae]
MALIDLAKQTTGLLARTYDSLSRPLHPSVAELIGRNLPSLDGPWLEPFNGQHARQRMFRSLVSAVRPASLFESGSYRGASTRFLWHVSGKPVYTAEKNPNFARYVAREFRHVPEVKVLNHDSRDALRILHTGAHIPSSKPFLCYLDAHWDADLPLRDEVAFILQKWPLSVIVIDDFKVPDDSGYGFDAYGPTELSVDYLGQSALAESHILWPSCPAREETGYRRGCVVLASPQLADAVGELPELRRIPGLTVTG